jgi:hypothetical protein
VDFCGGRCFFVVNTRDAQARGTVRLRGGMQERELSGFVGTSE